MRNCAMFGGMFETIPIVVAMFMSVKSSFSRPASATAEPVFGEPICVTDARSSGRCARITRASSPP
jgi:hypothetical protein